MGFYPCAVAGLTLLFCPLSLALPTQTFQVSANIVNGCLVQGSNTGVFGAINFGTYPGTSKAQVNASYVQNAAITLVCTPGTNLQMSIDGGVNYSTGRNLKLSGNTNLVPYNIYNSATNVAIPVNQAVPVTFTNANNIVLPLYGQLTLGGNSYAGSYADTLTVTLSW
ncbi:spore coat protein U-like protein [Serratia fonticola]|jgi:spore coat protein U-like protein|uniref:Spore coat protein U-like protein n=1 Tax=Serratia fonticola TaxID=47917 RepID=A0A559TC29_SERFO|nr:spore coat U domain-containing protein [Serratia fonticola]TQI80303.1 spore coat protein U-like protein [Serratia fonticola]TQI97670.1 spore coat protein U-like protein [Serratia fonticola]TVZ72168.1 spore coat protein U-like protein [Serratia fonticola]